MIIVSLVILLFLWHIPSAIVPIVTIPVSVLLAFIPMYFMGVTVNIMSLAGIAISIGVLVDGAIVEVENAYNKLQRWQAGGRKGDFHAVRLEALKEVGPSVFFSLLVIAVAFLPVFTLVDQEGRLFKPLAYSKNLAMAHRGAARDHARPGDAHAVRAHGPVHASGRAFAGVARQQGAGRHVLRRGAAPDQPGALRGLRAGLPLRAAAPEGRHRRRPSALVAVSVPVYFRLGSEFMPPLNEGTILYMPTTLPGISVQQAQELLRDAGPDPASRSPRSSGSSARPAAPRRRPTRRRSR